MAVTRRNFMFGTLASAAGAALILRPNGEDALKLFEPTLQETLAISRIPKYDPKAVRDPWALGDMLYAADGTAVMYVREYSIRAPVDGMINITAIGDLHESFIPSRMGRDRGSIEVNGYPIKYPDFGG